MEALEHPVAPRQVNSGVCKEKIHHAPCDVGKIIFTTRGASQSNHYYYQPVVFTKHPVTGAVNVGQYPVSLQQPGQVTVNLRMTQHGGLHLQAAKEQGVPLQVAICIGVPPALYVAVWRPFQFNCASVMYPARKPTARKMTAVAIVSFFIGPS